jgi:hypothetical protein
MTEPNTADHSRETGWPEGVTISVCGVKSGGMTPEEIEDLRVMAWRLNDQEWTPEERAAMAEQQARLDALRARVAAKTAKAKRECIPGCAHRGCHHLNVKEGAGGFGECQDCGEEVV